MTNEELKRALISEIESCQNNDLLLEAFLLLTGQHDYPAVNEAETDYKLGRVFPVPQEHWDLLKDQLDEYLKGNIEATSWEDLKKELFEDL